MEKKLKWNGQKLKDKRELKERLEKKRVSQSAIADFLDITPQSYGEMERGEIKPDSNNLTKLCIYFDCPAQDFFDVPENFFVKV